MLIYFQYACSNPPKPFEVFYSNPVKRKKYIKREKLDERSLNKKAKKDITSIITPQEYQDKKNIIYNLEKKSKAYYQSYLKNRDIEYLHLSLQMSNQAIFEWLKLQNEFNTRTKMALNSLLERKRACYYHQNLARKLYKENVKIGNLQSKYCFFYLN